MWPNEDADRAGQSHSEPSWMSGEFPSDGRKASVGPLKNCQRTFQGAAKLAGFLFVPGKIRAWVFLELVSGQEKNELVGNNQHGFIQGQPRMASPIASAGRMGGFLDEGGAVDVIDLDPSEAFTPSPTVFSCSDREVTVRAAGRPDE